MSAETVFSPELVLVSPDLREAALAALPERDPDVFLDFNHADDNARPKPEFDRLALIRAYMEGGFLADTLAPESDCFDLLADSHDFLAEPTTPHPRRPVLITKAAAYAIVALAQLLLIWGVAVTAVVAVATVVSIWLA